MADNDLGGVWRTIGGRRVFIKNGQSLEDAMRESGKFSRVAKNQELYKKVDEENKKIDEIIKKDEDNKKTVHTTSGNYTFEEMKARDKEIKDLYKAQWNGEMTATELNDKLKAFREEGRLSYGEQQALQYDASMELEKEKGIIADYENGKINSEEVLNKFDNEEEMKKAFERMGYTAPTKENIDKANARHEEFMKNLKEKETANTEPVEDRLPNNMIVSHYGDDVAYRDKNNNLWVTSREQYNDYVNGKKDKIGGELVANDDEALKTMISNEGLNKFPYEGYVRDEKTENNKKYKEFVDSEYNRLKDQVEDSSNARYERAKTNDNYKMYNEEFESKRVSEPETGFTQKLDMYGGTREYSKEQLDKMKEAGIQPMEHSYTGGGWEGVNSNLRMDTKDQAKAITDAMKKQYPDVKISRKTNLFSGGSSIDFNIMSSDKDLYVSDADIDKINDFDRLSTGYGFENWAEKNVKGFKRYTNEVYTTDDVRKYAKEVLSDLKKRDNQNVRGNEWYLSDYGKKVVSELNKQANSYTYNDSDGMVDYFDHGTYMHISIGKYNKPYEVNKSSKTTNDVMNDVLREKAYKNYLKQHPGSKMTFEEFNKKK